MHNPIIAATYAELYEIDDLRDIQRNCLQIEQDGGEVTKSYGGGSITISAENVERTLENVAEAVRILQAADAGTDPDVSAEPLSSGVSFANRYIE